MPGAARAARAARAAKAGIGSALAVALLAAGPASAAATPAGPTPAGPGRCGTETISYQKPTTNVIMLRGPGRSGMQTAWFHNTLDTPVAGLDFSFSLALDYGQRTGPMPDAEWRMDSGPWQRIGLSPHAAGTDGGNVAYWDSDRIGLGDIAPGATHAMSFRLAVPSGNTSMDYWPNVFFRSAQCMNMIGMLWLWSFSLDPSPVPSPAHDTARGSGTTPAGRAGTVVAAASPPVTVPMTTPGPAPITGSPLPATAGTSPTAAVSTSDAPSATDTASASKSGGSALPWIFAVAVLAVGLGGFTLARRRPATATATDSTTTAPADPTEPDAADPVD